MANQKGFTLIELVVVIVILGILAAVAVPKFIDLQTDAYKAHANAVLATAKSAASMNYAKSMLDSVNPKVTADAAGATYLLTKMEVEPDWTAGASLISATLGGTLYTITISVGETATSPAKFTPAKF